MSKSSTKSSSSSTGTTTSNSTTTPTVAPWLNQGYQDLSGLIGKYASTDPSSYVTGPNANQTAAFGSAGQLGQGQQLINRGAGLVSSTQNAPIATANPGEVFGAQVQQGDIDRFMNPYLKNVVDTALADYDVDSGRTRASQSANAALNKAFGGSRYAIREAQTEGELARGRGALDANLRSQAFSQALGAATQQADRNQQANLTSYTTGANAGMFNAGQQNAGLDRNLTAAGLLGNFGTSMDANTRANIGAQLDLGNTERGISNEQAQALPAWLQSISQLYGSIPIGSFTSLNQQGTGTSAGTQQGKSTTTGASFGWSPTGGFSFGV